MDTAQEETISSTDESLVPPLPEGNNDGWAMVWRALRQVQTDNELLRIEMAFYKSQNEREKSAERYAEEAVAAVYGWEREDFYGPRRIGRPSATGASRADPLNEPRFVLYTILHNVIGVPVSELAANYKTTVSNHISRWQRLFNLIHQPKTVLSPAEQVLHDKYAPRYRAAYARMRGAMKADGCWREVYEFTPSILADDQP